MDTSELYIKMCEKAQEIQELKKNISEGFYFGEILTPTSSETRVYSVGEFNAQENAYGYDSSESCDTRSSIWLPRQDQLQEMVEGLYDNKLYLMLNFKDIFLDPYDYDEKILIEYINYSFEQLWLIFVMKENYNKIWNSEKEEWGAIK